MLMDTLALLLRRVPTTCTVVESNSRLRARIDVSIVDSVGETIVFHLELLLHSTKPQVFVFELEPRQLPARCPARHITMASTFCFALDDEAPRTSREARAWWQRLIDYLGLQLRATHLRRWPGPEWEHGAVRVQQQLESAIDREPSSVRAWLRAVVFEDVSFDDEACPCGSDTNWLQCHARALEALAPLREELARARAAYWEGCNANGAVCCETMDRCGIRRKERET